MGLGYSINWENSLKRVSEFKFSKCYEQGIIYLVGTQNLQEN